MARKIAVLSDGTGNSSAALWRTNVWRTFDALDLSGSDQVAFYDDGVGTSSFKPLAVLGGAFGIGLKRNNRIAESWRQPKRHPSWSGNRTGVSSLVQPIQLQSLVEHDPSERNRARDGTQRVNKHRCEGGPLPF
jgi:hypothetical protein